MTRAKKLIEEAKAADDAIKAAKAAEAERGHRRTIAGLQARLKLAEERAGVAEALAASARPVREIKAATANLHKRVATPVFVFSDWHVEEVVEPRKVLGLNAYTPEIAEQRIARLGEAAAWMIEHHRKSFDVRECVVGLLGDFLSGYIHDELVEGNAMSPTEAVLWLQDRISDLIVARLLAVPGIERVTFVCTRGNHGRTTQKVRVATGAENSYEWLLYHQLRRQHGAHPRVEWHVADGEFIHVNVHGLGLGFTHGDAVNYGGGVGGITIPIKRAIPRWNSFRHADTWFMGHFHSLHYHPGLVVNGSLIGTAPYGMRVGSMEVPAQASLLIDSKRGPCMNTTLWVTPSEQGKGARRG